MSAVRLLAAAFFLFGLLLSAPASALDYEDYPVVRLRTLDKITARTMTFEARVGATMKFGEIFIKVQTCRKPPPVEKSEAAAFLQVWETDTVKDESRWVFSGWMFASSPTLSAMDHPVYDVWVIDCLGKDPEALPPPEAAPESVDGGDGTIPVEAAQPQLPPSEQLGEKQITPAAVPDEEMVPEEESVPATNLPSDARPAQAPTPVPEESDPTLEGIY